MDATPSVWPAVLAFAAVIVAIPLALLALKRLQAGSARSGNMMRLVGGMTLGPRERLAIVEAQGRWLLIGVTAHSVNLLSTLERPEGDDAVPPSPAAAAHPFARLLSQWSRNA